MFYNIQKMYCPNLGFPLQKQLNIGSYLQEMIPGIRNRDTGRVNQEKPLQEQAMELVRRQVDMHPVGTDMQSHKQSSELSPEEMHRIYLSIVLLTLINHEFFPW